MRRSARIIFVIFLMLAFCGNIANLPAQTKWVNPDKTAQEVQDDLRDCQMKATQMEHARRAQGKSRLEFRESDYFDDCMRDKGYVPDTR